MIVLQIVFSALSLLVLGAHFLRSGSFLLVLAALALACLLMVRRPWAARAAQAALALGAVEWIRTLIALASERMQQGQPATRMAIILGAVALVAGICALGFESAPVKRFYGAGRAGGKTPGGAPGGAP